MKFPKKPLKPKQVSPEQKPWAQDSLPTTRLHTKNRPQSVFQD